MKTLLSAALLLAVACASAPPAQTSKPLEAIRAEPPQPLVEVAPALLYAQAREKMAAKDWPSARAGLDAFLKQEPGSAAGHFDAGWVAEQAGDRASARGHYEQALKAEPEHIGAALNLARQLRIDERLADAQRVLEAALEKRDGDVRLLNALAAVLRRQKKLDEAERAVRKVLLRHPRDPGAYKNLALIEVDRGRLRLAEVALNNARKLDDKDAGILNNLGLLAARREDPSAARARFQEAASVDARYAPAWANLGALALQFRDYKSAAEAYGKATALDPQRTELHLAYAWALEGLKKPKEARAQYEQVLAANPRDQDALYGRALALKTEGNLPEAMKAFQAYVAVPGAARTKDAQTQIASIDIRLKNQAPVAKAEPLKREAKGAADLSALPIGKDEEAVAAGAPALPELPSDEPDVPATPVDPAKAEGPSDGKAPKKEEPAAKDGKANDEKGEGGSSAENEKPQANR